MKRLFLISLVSILFIQASYSQFNFGIRAGYNSSLSFSNFGSVFDGTYGLNNVQDEIWNNFQAGVFARVFMNKVYFEPALMYSLEKRNFEISLKDAVNQKFSFDSVASVKTLDIPLIFGLKVLDLKLANLRVFGGPKLRFDAGSTPTLKNEEGEVDVDNLVAQVKKANVGLEVGAGLDVLMFALDFRYNLINNMYELQSDKFKLDTNGTFLVTLSWKLF